MKSARLKVRAEGRVYLGGGGGVERKLQVEC